MSGSAHQVSTYTSKNTEHERNLEQGDHGTRSSPETHDSNRGCSLHHWPITCKFSQEKGTTENPKRADLRSKWMPVAWDVKLDGNSGTPPTSPLLDQILIFSQGTGILAAHRWIFRNCPWPGCQVISSQALVANAYFSFPFCPTLPSSLPHQDNPQAHSSIKSSACKSPFQCSFPGKPSPLPSCLSFLSPSSKITNSLL